MKLKTLLAATAAIALLMPGCVMVSPHGHHRSGLSSSPGRSSHPHGMPPGQAKKDCSHGNSKHCRS